VRLIVLLLFALAACDEPAPLPLGSPCRSNQRCEGSKPGYQGRCLSTENGTYCTGNCGADGDCPTGWHCAMFLGGSGGGGQFCAKGPPR
jgi:hypothetical protein